MSKLSLIDYVLSPTFKSNDSFLEEAAESMKIELVKDGCTSILFVLDQQLGREYKGGIYPFFNNSNSGVCKVCDYIIFAEKNKKLYALIIELKSGQQGALPQIDAGECFVDYVMATVNRVHKTNHNIEKRKISIREFERKKKTKIQGIKYTDNHHFFEQNKFRIQSFLK